MNLAKQGEYPGTLFPKIDLREIKSGNQHGTGNIIRAEKIA